MMWLGSKILKSFFVSVVTLTGLSMIAGLSACSDLSAPPLTIENRMEVHSQDYDHTFDTEMLTKTELRKLARHYDRYGGGDLNITVLYDPKSKRNTASKASEALSKILRHLKAANIHQARGDILPVRNQGEISKTIVDYKTYHASAPSECTEAPGLNGNGTDPTNLEYKLGCGMADYASRQIARPKDLAVGIQQRGKADANRPVRAVNTYTSGEPLPELTVDSVFELE